MSRHCTSNQPNKLKFPLHRLYPVVALLLLLAVGSFAWTSTTLAKYVTSASGGDSARVARFAVTASGADNQSLTLSSSANTASYSFTVSNTDNGDVNEVTTSYDVVVKFPSELSGVTLTLTNGAATIPGTSSDNITYTFSNAGTFQPGVEQTHNLTLTFTRGNNDASGAYSGISITVNAVQVD